VIYHNNNNSTIAIVYNSTQTNIPQESSKYLLSTTNSKTIGPQIIRLADFLTVLFLNNF